MDQESDADSDDSSEDFVFAHEGLDDMDTEADFVTEEDSESVFEGLDDTDTEADFSPEDLELEDLDDVSFSLALNLNCVLYNSDLKVEFAYFSLLRILELHQLLPVKIAV